MLLEKLQVELRDNPVKSDEGEGSEFGSQNSSSESGVDSIGKNS